MKKKFRSAVLSLIIILPLFLYGTSGKTQDDENKIASLENRIIELESEVDKLMKFIEDMNSPSSISKLLPNFQSNLSEELEAPSLKSWGIFRFRGVPYHVYPLSNKESITFMP